MKKYLILLFVTLLPMLANAYDAKIDGIYYNFSGNEAEVTYQEYQYQNYTYISDYTDDVVIPSSVTYNSKTYNVTSIGNCAFEDCSGLTSITIPNSVTSISSNAFYGCSGLTSITIPNSVTVIGYGAFSGCSGLTSVTIPNSVTSIGDITFFGCSSLTSVTIPNSVTSIGGQAFSYCSGLTSVIIPGSVTSIDSYAFSGCNSLTNITIPNSVTNIGGGAFSGCSSLTSVTIPDRVTRIRDGVFKGCSGLTSITIPNSVTNIGGGAFSGCSNLTSVSIPGSVTSIGSSAFSGCWGLTKVIAPDIAAWCVISFENNDANPLYYALHLYSDENTEMTDLVIPNSVTSISSYAFSRCSGLTSITIPESITTINEATFSGCTRLTTLGLPESLKIIRKQAFYNCWNLKSITIPATVEFIYQEAFAGCSALEVIKALPTTPPFLYDNSFSDFNVPVYVPTESIDQYRVAQGWKNFKSIGSIDSGDIPDPLKCATPTISYVNGKLKFSCETEDVLFNPIIKDDDIKSYSHTEEIDLCATYRISVYATKDGYENSEVATATLCWIDQYPATEGIIAEDAVTEVKALPVLIQTQGGIISIQGAAEGTPIAIYNTSGKQYGSAIAGKNCTNIQTSLQPGSTVIVRIGGKAIKVAIK